MDMTHDQLEQEFRRQVYLCSGLGFDVMEQIAREYFTAKHRLLHEPELEGRFRCESPRCPGYPYPAEYLAHPFGTCALQRADGGSSNA